MGTSITPGSGVIGDAVGLASITIMVLSPILKKKKSFQMFLLMEYISGNMEVILSQVLKK